MKRKFQKKAKAVRASELAQMGGANGSSYLSIAMENAMPPLSVRRSGADCKSTSGFFETASG
jgi:hypothetical protein